MVWSSSAPSRRALSMKVGLPLPRLLLSATSTVPSDRKFCTNAVEFSCFARSRSFARQVNFVMLTRGSSALLRRQPDSHTGELWWRVRMVRARWQGGRTG
jgi:hypothetical protein